MVHVCHRFDGFSPGGSTHPLFVRVCNPSQAHRANDQIVPKEAPTWSMPDREGRVGGWGGV